MDPARREARLSRGSGRAVVAVALVAGVAWTADRGVDELVDFGREAYVAWRLAEGDALYTDLRYEYGPLSAQLNGLVFRALGPGLHVLLAFNALLLALSTAALVRLLEILGGTLVATAGGLAFLALFGFGLFDERLLFHHLAPYHHGAVHGLLLGLVAVLVVHRHAARRSRATAAALGLLAGMAFLMKPEVALAVAAVAATGVLGRAWLQRGPWLRDVALATTAFCAPLAVVAVAGGPTMLLAAWRPLLDPTHMATHFASFSRHVLGLDDPTASIGVSLAGCVAWAVPLLPAWWLARRLPDGPRSHWLGGTLAFAAAGGLCLLATRDQTLLQWAPWGAPPAFVCAAAFAWTLGHLRRTPSRVGPTSEAATRLTALALAALGLALLSRTGIRPRFIDYGFVAGVGALAVTLLVGLAWLPARLEARGRAGWIFRGAALGLLACLVAGHLGLTRARLAPRTHALAAGRDRIRVGERGPVMQRALELIERHVPPGGDLLVLPEGVMLNYLARRPSSTPYLSFIPPLVSWFGEEEILRTLQARPPGHVLLVDRETGEFGPRRFGIDYAHDVGGWIRAHYVPVDRAGATPFAGNGFGVVLLAPREPAARAPAPTRQAEAASTRSRRASSAPRTRPSRAASQRS